MNLLTYWTIGICFALGVAWGMDNQTSALLASLKQLNSRNKRVSAGWGDIFKVFRDVPARRLSRSRGIPSASVQAVKQHLRRSYISSCSSEKMMGMTCVCNAKYKDIAIITDENVQSLALIAADITTRHIVVTYRPTMTLKNWIANADFPLVQMRNAPSGVLVHRGFHNFHVSLVDKVFAAAKRILSKPAYRHYTVHITGYSLGGAIATMSTPDWKRFMVRNNFTHPLESYSYSSPRVGNEKFAQYVASAKVPTIRYTNNNDVVPHLPPRSLDFVHAGLEYHLQDGRISQCRQDCDEDPACAIKYNFPLSFSLHYFPDGKLLPLPPYC